MDARILFGILLGAAIGVAVGLLGQRAGGACPLMCNPYGGAVFGAVVGALIAASLGRGTPSYTPSPHLVSIESAEAFEEKVLQAEGPVLIEFYTTRCPHCKRMEPVIHSLADRFAGRATIAKVNPDDVPSVFQRYNVQSVPTVFVFHEGQVAAQAKGYHSEQQSVALLEPYLPPEEKAGESQ